MSDIHDQLELYAAGALTGLEMLAFDEHLEGCGLCRSRMPALFDVVANLIPDSPAPAGAWNRIVAAIEDAQQTR